jgi:hypothetical protein
LARTKKLRSWLAAEIKAIKDASKNLIPAPKIARMLKRTEGAIRQKALALGVSLNALRRGKVKKKKAATKRGGQKSR